MDKSIADLVAELRQFAEAYPESVFGPVTDEEVKQHASLITRNSAAMGRHFAPWFTRAADEIERLGAAGDRLAHELMHAQHKAVLDAWFEARGGQDQCTVCNPPPDTRTNEP